MLKNIISFIIFIVLFTAAFGRLFCGWVCPQTIFMEMLFRKVEYLIEGDAAKQKLLKKSPWTAEKIRKKATKHTVFFILAFFIGIFYALFLLVLSFFIDVWFHLEFGIYSIGLSLQVS